MSNEDYHVYADTGGAWSLLTVIPSDDPAGAYAVLRRFNRIYRNVKMFTGPAVPDGEGGITGNPPPERPGGGPEQVVSDLRDVEKVAQKNSGAVENLGTRVTALEDLLKRSY